MGLVELLVGLVVVGSGSPWILRWGLKGYRQLLVQYRALSAENEAVDMSKPVQVSRQEDWRKLTWWQKLLTGGPIALMIGLPPGCIMVRVYRDAVYEERANAIFHRDSDT